MAYRPALEDVQRRLVAVTAMIDPRSRDAAQLRLTASELEAIVHRLRWIADVAGSANSDAK